MLKKESDQSFKMKSDMNINRNSESKLLKYFNLTDGIHMKFAHAVNSQEKLKAALEDPSVVVIEADVLRDPLQDTIIMAHPPATTSDLTLRMFLERVFSSHPVKSIKLDFKLIEVVKPSLEILKEFKLQVAKDKDKTLPPILLNADILRGPGNPKTRPVDAKSFLEICRSYGSEDVLSLGWTTYTGLIYTAVSWLGLDTSLGLTTEGYSWDMVKEMQDILNDATEEITFPIRASLVKYSREQLLWLLSLKDNFSLSIWHSNVDTYSAKELAFLRDYPTEVFYDLPAEKVSELNAL